MFTNAMHLSPRTTRFILVAVVFVFAGSAGFSGILYPSVYSPLVILGGLAGAITVIAWLARPVWALYAALFIVLLPLGLIPVNIQSILNRSVTVIAVGVWLVYTLKERKKINLTGPALCLLIFIVWSTVTLLWAEKTGPGIVLLQTYTLRFLLFLLLIPNMITTMKDLDGLMKTLAFSGWVLIFSFIGTLFLKGYTVGSRLKILSGNENGTGVLALITLGGMLWLAYSYNNNQKSLLLRQLKTAAFITLTCALVAMTGSRGSALSLVVMFCVILVWKPLRIWGQFGFLIAITAGIVIPSIFTTLLERFIVTGSDTLLGGREVLWHIAWRIIQERPLTGVGIANSPYTIVQFFELDSRLLGVEKAAIHNPILTVWSETGILGVLLYMGIPVTAALSFSRQYLINKRKQRNELIPYFAIVSAIALGYSVSWFKGGGMESDFSYFMILALLILPSVIRLDTDRKDATIPQN